MNRPTHTQGHPSQRPVYVVDGSRTPFLTTRGRANPFSATDLAVAAGRPLLLRQPFEADALDEVILGCVIPAPDEVNIARVASLRLGCGPKTPAWTVQRNCASGMQALDTAVRNIQGGHAGLILAGGVDAMSRAPLQWRPELVEWMVNWRLTHGFFAKMRALSKLSPRYLRPVITLLKGLTDPTVGLSMGQTAEELAHRFDISRQAMDSFALESQNRLKQAQEEGLFEEEITPLFSPLGPVISQDQGLHPNSQMAKLAKLKPVFDRPTGLLTAGNSAQITDGACWLLLASQQMVEQWNLKPLGRISPASWAGLDPSQMGLGPAHAISELLLKENLPLEEVAYWEINEAFAAQVIACTEAMASPDYCQQALTGRTEPLGTIPRERLNVDGGAISLGHPVGASGARIVLHLLHTLRRKQAKRGVAALCIGGGQGGAMLAEAL
ncbi:MAG: acetyl-CoA C-acetyltransferase [Magnetococcales bacterium]|nr:acetyl-CoA C-acetyltransferase [Magnetococcales bacterium]